MLQASADLGICWASVLECAAVASPGTVALPGQPTAEATEDKQGRRRGARGEEKCQQREGEEDMRMCWGREEQAAVKAAGVEGGYSQQHGLPWGANLGIHVAPGTWRWNVWRQCWAMPFLEVQFDVCFIVPAGELPPSTLPAPCNSSKPAVRAPMLCLGLFLLKPFPDLAMHGHYPSPSLKLGSS